MKLRPYQATVLDNTWDWFTRHDDGNPIVEAAVGAGKSLMIAAVAQRADREAPGTRILVIVHQKELLEQNVDKLLKIWPSVDVGIYSAGAGRRQLDRQITYATIGSIYKKAYDLGRIDMVMADECHLINPKETGMWREFLAALARTCPHARVIGWTGTPYRGNGVWLTAGKDALFTHIAAKITMRELLEQGYLSPLTPVATEARISTDGVRTSGDDYVVSDLAKAADKAELVEATCEEIVHLAQGRRRWLVFAVTIEHAEHCRDALRRRGVAAELVTGTTPKAERERLIQAYRQGRIKCLVNVAVLTTGFDVPEVDFIALLRATKSPVLYVQIGGRGMRLADGKTDCLWADFTDTTARMGPIDAIKGREPAAKGAGGAPFRICDQCGSRNHASALQCVDCGFMFPEPERIKHGDKASGEAVLTSQVESKRPMYTVDDVRYRLHSKQGSPDSVLVQYYSGIQVVAKEWVCMDHEGFVRMKAEAWWRRRAVNGGLPANTADALVLAGQPGHLRRPSQIQVSLEGKHPEIIYYEWGPTT